MLLSDVLLRGWPGAEWTLSGDEFEGLVWLSGAAPSKAEVESKRAEFEAAAPWDEIRVQRDTLLQRSDWTQVADAPVDSAAWAVYRQALRDVPQDFDSPDDVVWPTPPA